MHNRISKAILTFTAACMTLIHAGAALQANDMEHMLFDPVPADRLPSVEVRKLYQDEEGFIWIPTYDGIARYDGYDTVIYRISSDGDGHSVSNRMNTLCEYEDSVLLVGSELGLLTLDKKTGKLSKPSTGPTDECNISSIVISKDYGIFIGADKGLFVMKPETGRSVRIDLRDYEGKPVEAITSLCIWQEEFLWICSFQCGLIRYNIKDGSYRLYPEGYILTKAHVAKMAPDGNLWVGTWGEGLAKVLNPASDEAAEYYVWRNDPKVPTSILDNIIYDMDVTDPSGMVWVGSRKGLSVLTDQTEYYSFRNWMPSDKPGSLPFNEVNSLMRGRDGILYAGLLGGGVTRIMTESLQYGKDPLTDIRQHYSTGSVRSICRAGDGALWLGILDYGLVYYDMKEGWHVHYSRHPDLGILPYTSTISSIVRRSDGTLCFGSWNNGIWTYDCETGSVRITDRFNRDNFYDDCVQTMEEDPEGNLWIGTRRGVFIKDCSGGFHTLGEWTGAATPVDSIAVFDISCSVTGDIWIATNGAGIFMVSGHEITGVPYDTGIASMPVNSIFAAPDGSVWAGSVGKGLLVKPAGEDVFRNLSGFPCLSEGTVHSIICDKDSRIWTNMDNSVFSFFPDSTGNPAQLKVCILDTETGHFAFNRNSAAVLDSGKVVFGCSEGLRIFRTGSVPGEQEFTPVPVISDFRVNGRSLRSLPERERARITEQDINYADGIRLSHRQNSFTVDFALPADPAGSGRLFRYRLEGYDPGFMTADSRYRHVSYKGLPPGKYIFRLSAITASGRPGDGEKILPIRILQSPWLSWWAWILYFAAVAAMATAAGIFVRNRKMTEEIQSAKEETERIRKLLRDTIESGSGNDSMVLKIKKLDHTPEDEAFMARIMKIVNEHLSDGNFSLADFSGQYGASRTVLAEKLKELTGLTPSAFITDVRLRAAKKLLEEQPDIRIADLAYSSGFNDSKYFSTCFRKKFGISPTDFVRQRRG